MIMEQYLRIGVITRAHGVHGEVKVFPTTDYPERFEEIKDVVIRTPKGEICTEVEGVKYFKNLAIVKFGCFHNPEEIQGLSGSDIMISREQAQPLEEGEYYIADLIGCRVICAQDSECLPGKELGTVTDVLQTGANDVYVVGSDTYGEILIPAIKACILQVSVRENRMTVHLLPGLLPGR